MGKLDMEWTTVSGDNTVWVWRDGRACLEQVLSCMPFLCCHINKWGTEILLVHQPWLNHWAAPILHAIVQVAEPKLSLPDVGERLLRVEWLLAQAGVYATAYALNSCLQPSAMRPMFSLTYYLLQMSCCFWCRPVSGSEDFLQEGQGRTPMCVSFLSFSLPSI
jgi:hypothetical protein